MQPKTAAQRQQALRERRAAQGLTEVRGIYLPPALHQWLKQMAKSNPGPADTGEDCYNNHS